MLDERVPYDICVKHNSLGSLGSFQHSSKGGVGCAVRFELLYIVYQSIRPPSVAHRALYVPVFRPNF